MKYKVVTVRLDEIELEELRKHAKAANTDMSKQLRSYMYECQSGFDRKHEEQLAAFRKLSSSVENLNRQLELVEHMCASIAGGVAILPGPRLGEPEALEVRQNGLAAFGLGGALMHIQKDLLSTKKG